MLKDEVKEKYMEFAVGRAPSFKEYVLNFEGKMQDDEFLTDVQPLLRPDIEYNPNDAYELVFKQLIDKMRGKRD